MLLPPTSRSSRSHRSSRFGRRRRHIRKLASICYLLSVLCAISAGLFFLSSRMQEKKVARKQLIVCVAFLGSVPVLAGLGVTFNWWKHRFYGRGQSRRSSSDGHGHAQSAHVSELPSR